MPETPTTPSTKFAVFSGNVKRYLVIKTAASLGTGVAIGLWLAVLGVDYPVLWGVLAFLLNYVPQHRLDHRGGARRCCSRWSARAGRGAVVGRRATSS